MALDTTVDAVANNHVAALLQQAREAHAQFETVILKQPDPNWPRWLAGFSLDRNLNHLIPKSIGEDELAHLLQKYETEYVDRHLDESRSEYYARRLQEDSRSA